MGINEIFSIMVYVLCLLSVELLGEFEAGSDI